MSEQYHEMQLTGIDPSGAEEWHCPACGRRLLMSWPPAYKRVVLEAGDDYAIHSGGTGGLHLSRPSVGEPEPPGLSEEMRAALEDALKDVDLDDPSGVAGL